MMDATECRRRSDDALNRATLATTGSERSQLISEAAYWFGRAEVEDARTAEAPDGLG